MKSMSFRTPDRLHNQIKTLSDKMEWRASEVINRALEEYLEKMRDRILDG